jgi:transposase-like protein
MVLAMSTEPRTLTEAIRHFADPDVSLKTMVELRWPNGVRCPTCGREDVRFIATRRMWECKEKHPKRQFSAKIGTIFEDSPLGLDKWFSAIWMIANCKNGVSSYEIHRAIGVTQKTAWFMLHRIRLAMETGSFLKSGGTNEADETFIGGLAKNMHKARRKKAITGTGFKDKAAVMGVLRRGSDAETSRVVVARHVPDTKATTLHPIVRAAVEPGSELFTDTHSGYRGLAAHYVHEVVDHSIEYVRGKVHTNGMENFWSLFKRTLKGTYVSVEPFHLNAYVVEQTFRYNERRHDDGGRFRRVLGAVSGKRITYKELIADGAPAPA